MDSICYLDVYTFATLSAIYVLYRRPAYPLATETMQVTNLFLTDDERFRAVSAANVLLADGLVVKLTDLGMSHQDNDARAHQALAQAGTPVYHAAEVLMGLGCSTATDIYALG